MPRIMINHANGEVDTYENKKGVNLYHLLAEMNLLDAPCGGMGSCGKCKVRILPAQPAVQETEAAFFSEKELAAGWRLACLHSITEDIRLELAPPEKVSEIISTGYVRDFSKNPYLGKILDQDGNTLIVADNEMIGLEMGDTRDRLFGLAIDIGTTTVVVSLIDILTGQEITSVSCLNGQKTFGQDVLSRIHYAMTHEKGTLIQQKAILQDIRNLIRGIFKQGSQDYAVAAKDIYEITVGANNTMVHLLAGKDPASLGKSPYLPAFQGALWLQAVQDLQLPVSAFCSVYCLPAVSAFVGGDITAGILACGIHQDDRNLLFIDIGTNGEIVLSRNGKLWACSCAAGPALEGMNISCGVRAARGAVEDVVLKDTGADLAVEISVIGGGKAVGLCGSGLLAAVAELRRIGILHRSGRLLDHPLVENAAGKKRFIISNELGIYLTQQDIRQVQLAKAAILSGIQTLLKENGMVFSEIDEVLVAGQFGAHLKAESLTGAGFFPRELQNRISYVGNTSKSGAYLCLLSAEERKAAEKIAQDITYIELSHLPDYDTRFIKAMEF